MLKGENYASQLYENWSNRLAINTFLKGVCGVIKDFDNELEVTASGSNIYVDSGVAIIKGGIVRNTTSATLPVQLEANQYCIVVLEIDLTQINTNDNFNQGALKILTNSGSYPELTQQNIELTPSSGTYQFELARFTTNTTEIQNLTDKRKFLDYYATNAEDVSYDNANSGLLADNVQSAIDELSGYLNELEEI